MRICVVLIALYGSAAAARERVAIGSFRVEGNADVQDDRRTQARASFLGGLAAAGFEVATDDEIKKVHQSAPELAHCETDACLQGLARRMEVAWVLAGQLEIIGSTYVLSTRLLSAEKGDVGIAIKEECTACSTREADNWLSAEAASLKVKADAVSTPKPPVLPPPPPRGLSDKGLWALRISGIVAGVLGLAGIVIGAAYASDHGDPGCQNATADCPVTLDNSNGMAFGFTTGALLLAGAGVMSYFGWRPQKKQISLVPALSRDSIGVQIRLGF
jgi:hypothetical protein